jgi:D-cysteine desulfhydrase family pyridoxal phosphate-dependent enzyme
VTDWRSFPRIDAGVYPTPLEEMPRLREALGGGPRLFIKRDDYTGPAFGGNKVRKLEFVLAAARAEGADSVLTMGGLRSNHCRVTAALAAKAGFECHLILNGQSADVPASLYLDRLYGAIVHPVATGPDRRPAMDRLTEQLRAEGRKPYPIPLGASMPLGALGYVRAAEEIIATGISFDALFHSTSSAGTQAGLVAGLDGSKTRVIGVSADDPAEKIGARVGKIVAGIGDLLDRTFDPRIEVDDVWIGAGYGIGTPEGAEAIRLFARTEGVVLDPVYTAKAAAAMIGRIRSGEFSSTDSILFLHTGGQLALFTAPPSSD